jgi:hypothetical protein
MVFMISTKKIHEAPTHGRGVSPRHCFVGFGGFGMLGTFLAFKPSGQLIQFMPFIVFSIGSSIGVPCR